MIEERRGQVRCPVCQGPAKRNEAGTIQCRRSTCIHNHSHVRCPRCGANELESVNFTDQTFVYTCAACTATFQIKA